MDLYHYFVTNMGRNILKNPHYFPIYERHFRKYVNHPVTFFEIGTGDGGSCQMWKYYFGPQAKIVTIDIADKRQFAEEQIYVRTGDQSDHLFLNKLVEEFGPPDVVLDDGSHMMQHINASFDFLYPRMNRNGTYLVEDLDGAYWAARGGGLHNEASFIERCKKLIDEMNYRYTNGQVVPSELGEDISNISFYHMMVVIERAAYENSRLVRRPLPL